MCSGILSRRGSVVRGRTHRRKRVSVEEGKKHVRRILFAINLFENTPELMTTHPSWIRQAQYTAGF